MQCDLAIEAAETASPRPARVLILANAFISDAGCSLPREIREQAKSASEVLVVAPALTSFLQSWVSDVDGPRAQAAERLAHIASDVGAEWGTTPRTAVGDEDQILAVEDALVGFAADALVVVVHAREGANYHEHGIAEKLRARFGLPTTTLVVDSEGRLTGHELSAPTSRSLRSLAESRSAYAC